MAFEADFGFEAAETGARGWEEGYGFLGFGEGGLEVSVEEGGDVGVARGVVEEGCEVGVCAVDYVGVWSCVCV